MVERAKVRKKNENDETQPHELQMGLKASFILMHFGISNKLLIFAADTDKKKSITFKTV